MNESFINPYESSHREEKNFWRVLKQLGVGDPRSDILSNFPFGKEAVRLGNEFNSWKTAHPDAENLEQQFIEYLERKLKQKIEEHTSSSDNRQLHIQELMQEFVRRPLQTMLRVKEGHAVLPKAVSLHDFVIEDEFNTFVRENSLPATIRPPLPAILHKGQKVEATWPMINTTLRTATGVLSGTLTYGAGTHNVYIDTHPVPLYVTPYPSNHQYQHFIDGSITRFEERSDGSYIIYFRGFAHVPERWLILKPL